MRPVNRFPSKLQVNQVKTYQASSPVATHFRVGTCKEVNCPHWLYGWQTLIDEGTSFGQKQTHYIRKVSGRHFTERRAENGLTIFTFPSEQKCFREHQVRLDRPEVFTKFDGDWRGRLGELRVMRGDNWQEDFAEHQDKLAREYQKGA